MLLGDYIKVSTGKLDANAASENGKYPFFTCSKEILKIDNYAFDCECVLLAGNGDLNVKYYNGKFNAYQRTYVIESLNKDVLDVKFLYLFFEFYLFKLKHIAIGGVIKYIKLENITKANIFIPSLKEQKEIVYKIEKLKFGLSTVENQLNLLDELIKSRFVEMFETIDLGEERPEWVELEKLTKIYTGTTPSSTDESNWNGDILWITPAEMDSNSFYIYDTVRKITEKGRKSKSLDIMPINTVLLSTRAPIGKVGIVGKPMTCNQGFKNFECSPKLNSIFLYTLLKNNTDYLNSLGSGTTFLEVSKSRIAKLRVPVPDIELQNQFADFVSQVDKSKFVYHSKYFLCDILTLFSSTIAYSRVVSILAWPSIFCTCSIGMPLSIAFVAKVLLNLCGCTLPNPMFFPIFFNTVSTPLICKRLYGFDKDTNKALLSFFLDDRYCCISILVLASK